MRKEIHERIIKLKSQPRWVVRCFMALGIVLGGIFAFVSNPIGGTNAQTPTTATLKPGQEISQTIKRLVPGHSSYTYSSSENSIKHIVRSNTEPGSQIIKNTISIDNSEKEVLAWYDGDSHTVYYYTEADTIYLNGDSSDMFYGMQGLETSDDIDMSGWDTSKVTNMYGMFAYCSNLTELDLSSWDTSKVTYMRSMFEGCSKLETIYVGSGFKTNQANGNYMFSSVSKLIGGNGTRYNSSYTDRTYARIDNQSQSGYFTAKEGDIRVNFIVDGEVWSSTTVEFGGKVIEENPEIEGKEFKKRVDKNGIEFDFEKGIDRYTEIFATFYSNEAILKPGQEFNNILSDLAGGINQIQHIVRSTKGPEAGVTRKPITLPYSDNKVVAWYDESNYTIYYYVPRGVRVYFNKNSSYMFYNMNSLKTVDFSDRNSSRVTNTSFMFYLDYYIQTIYANTGFSIDQVTNSSYMFGGEWETLNSLRGGNGTQWSSSHTDVTYARIDETGQPGYFTYKEVEESEDREEPEDNEGGDDNTGGDNEGGNNGNTGGGSSGGHNGGGSAGGSVGGGSINEEGDTCSNGSCKEEINSAENFEFDTLRFNPNYSDEMNQAYQYAYHYGITTKESVKEADMGGSLTRIAMAKMLSNYAINVLGKNNFDESRDCGFVDVSPMMNIEYDNGITNACKLGIMGINMPNGKFRPNDPVTRAEFVTALSRMKYNTPDGEYTYYSTHMKLLNRLGVITNTDPTMKELRGYVMIMLMRAK